MSSRPLLSLLAAVVLWVGCGGSTPGPAVGISGRPPRAEGEGAPVAAESALPMLPAHAVAALDDDGALAAFARADDGPGLLLFAQGGSWRARPVDAHGAPTGEAVIVAAVPASATHLALRPAGDGFLVAWDAAVDANHALSVVALDAAGRPRGAPSLVAQVADRVAFVDLIVFDGGAFLLHEVSGRGPRAAGSRVVLTLIDPRRGTSSGAGSVVVDDASGWNVVATRRGAAVARVISPAGPTPAGAAPGPELGRVEVAAIDARGVAAAPIAVLTRPTANIDVELAPVGGRVLVAWTDGADAEGAAMLASADTALGKTTAPTRISPPAEDVALVGLWSAPRGAASSALIAWEPIDPGRPATTPRRFVLATVDATGAASTARAVLPFAGTGRPDVVADGDGFAALVLAPAALAGDEAGAEAPVWPTFVRMGADLAARASEPLRAAPFVDTEGVPDLAFGLSCSAGSCLAIGGAAGAPAPLAAIELPIRASRFRPALERGGPSAATAVRTELATTLWTGERVADVAAARLDGGVEMAAWVGWYQPGVSPLVAPPRGEKPLAATLAVRTLASADGAPPIVISQRAVSSGGVALAPIPGKSAGEAVLAWVASDDGIPQVFATKLDGAGKKLAQKKVTLIGRGKKGRPTSECSAVDVAYAPQATDGRPGLVVAWVDTRDGDPEVYAARLNTNLEKVGADRRITTAKGPASEVRLLVRGAETLVAWIEAREAPENGDVYVAKLRTGNLEPVGDATRVFASAGATRGVRFVEGAGGRLLLSWIDDTAGDPKTGTGADGAAAAGVRLVELDASGKPTGSPRRVQALGPSVLEAALGCATGSCRGLAAVPGAPPRLLGVDVDTTTPGAGAWEVGTAQGNGVAIAALGADGKAFVIADDDGRSGRVRALRLDW